ncbi:MAG: alpha/beta hydrolase [Leptospiraceae bacterium]|nr:alpha/beta hydrolase [Leptospiraceae bacterium]MCK6381454.1 alpha/beta hydrolase [Leptospiraceae bacterium]NUM41453.1 alpha/beta hydrolase [Leptospiraceae bacterium]
MKKYLNQILKFYYKSFKKVKDLIQPDYRQTDIEVNEINIHLGEWPGSKDTVFCIHGITANHKSFQLIADFLHKNKMHIYAPDLRGRGRSDRPYGPYGIDTHVKDIIAIIDKLNLRNIVLIGHSLGCFISIHTVAKHPEYFKGLILLDGGGILNVWQKIKALSAIRPSLSRLGQKFSSTKDYIEQIKSIGLLKKWNPTMDDVFSYELDARKGGGVRNNLRPENIESELNSMAGSLKPSMIIKNFLHDPRRFIQKLKEMNQIPYEKIKCPVLILRAGKFNLKKGDDVLPLASMESMVKKIRKCKAYTLEDCNHSEIVLSENSSRDRKILNFIHSL